MRSPGHGHRQDHCKVSATRRCCGACLEGWSTPAAAPERSGDDRAAHAALAREGIVERAVSSPSWNPFEWQDQTHWDSVLPPAITARVSVEAGSVIGWDRYVGGTGARIGMSGFGASTLIKDVMTRFGLTPQKVLDVARLQIARSVG